MDGEIVIAGKNAVVVSNHSSYKVSQRAANHGASIVRVFNVEVQKPFILRGEVSVDDHVEGLFKFEYQDNEVVQYFSGIVVSLSMSLLKIRLDGEMKDHDNINDFLKNKIE